MNFFNDCIQSNALKTAWYPIVIGVLALAVYIPSLDNKLVYDDIFLLAKNPQVTEPENFLNIWSSDYWPGERPSYNYRPLTTVSFALVARVSGNSVSMQRCINIAFHVLCSLMLYCLARSLTFSPLTAFMTGVLFALHPIHTEAVYLIVGRGELQAAFFGLLFLWGLIENRGIAFLILFYGMALFSKENAAVLPVLGFLLYWLKFKDSTFSTLRKVVLKLAISTVPVLLLLFICRYRIFGVFLSPKGYVDSLYNPLVDVTLWTRMVNSIWVIFLYLKSMFMPIPLRADYSFCQIDLISSLWDYRLIPMFAILGFMVYLIIRFGQRLRLEAGSLLFCVIALLPVTNLLFIVGVMFGERLAYLSSAGFCLMAGSFIEYASRKTINTKNVHRIFCGIVVVILIIGAVAIVRRDRDWQDSEAFTSALVRNSPNSALAHGLRFLHLEEEGNRSQAEKHLQRALKIYPSYYDAWDSYGNFLLKDRRYRDAVEAYLKAAEIVALTPYDSEEAGSFLLKAANTQINVGDCQGALQSISRAGNWTKEML